MKKLIAAALAALTVALFTACANDGQLAYIGDEAARAAALTGAGLSAEAVTFLGTELASRDGTEYYLVSFTSGGSRYESQVDALSGVVLQTESAPLAQSASSPAEGSITAGDAKAKALAHAGLAETDVTFIKAELDRDDGRLVYDVEFYTADHKEYDYEIDAATGEVVSYDYDAEDYAPPAASGALSAEDAKALALAQCPAPPPRTSGSLRSTGTTAAWNTRARSFTAAWSMSSRSTATAAPSAIGRPSPSTTEASRRPETAPHQSALAGRKRPPAMPGTAFMVFVKGQRLGFTMLRHSRSPRSRPWMSTSAVAMLVASGMLRTSHRRSRFISLGS